MRRQRTYTREEWAYSEGKRKGLRQGITLSVATAIAGTVFGAMHIPDFLRSNRVEQAKERTEDVQFYQHQIADLLNAQGIELAEGTFPLVSADENTFSFKIIQGGISKICTDVPFTEYYHSARIERHIDLTKYCEKGDKPMPSTPPEGYAQ